MLQVISKKSGTPLEEKEVTGEFYSYEYGRTEVPAGCYVVKFSISDSGNNSSSEDDDIFACWQEDALYVEPGRETSKTIELPKLIYLPTWPESSTLTATSNSLQINFNWTTVLNAKNYELQIKEISDDETIPTNESTWDSLSDLTAQTISEINNNNYLFEVEETEAGKKYVARVRAINNCGKSA